MCHCGRTYFDAIGYSRKGLIVLDVKIKGHQVTAHQNDDNALYKTIPMMGGLKIIHRKNIRAIGTVKMTVTLNAGKQHNVVPSECDIVVDIALTIATLITKFWLSCKNT
jgi:acetylornithine deacetylase